MDAKPAAADALSAPRRSRQAVIVGGAFVLSGMAALLYQIVWQRVLLGLFGSHSESVAVVVAAFLFGIGLGSLLGGWLSRRIEGSLLWAFAGAELLVGVYGWFSLALFSGVGERIVGLSGVAEGGLIFLLVLLPTLMMGATLPLLVAHAVRISRRVAGSISGLYFANTLGAALGAFLATFWLLGWLGLHGTLKVAAAMNGLVVLVAVMGAREVKREEPL